MGLLLVAALTGCSEDQAPDPAPQVTRTVTTSADAAPTSEPSSRPAIPFTGTPRLGYVDGHTLRLPDGATVPLPQRWGISAIVTYAGGYLVSDDRIFEGTVGMQRLDADGRVLDDWASTGPPLLSRDGRVAWVSTVVSESGESGPTLLHGDSVDGGAEVTQEVDRTRLPFLTGWFRGRLVYETWGDPASYLTDLVRTPQAIPRAEDQGVPRPDGAYSARTTSEGVELLHADGQVTLVVRDPGLTRTQLNGLAWEDDRHLLATLTRGQRQCIVRIGLGGNLTRATGWRPATYAGFAFLSRTPRP